MNLNAALSRKYARPLASEPYLWISDHDGIAPLDAQIGVFPKQDVPAAAKAALFDGDDGALFALLDGAAIPGLQERLASEGLDHVCLFAGKAEQDFQTVAPWLVRLQAGSRLLRSLFTSAGRPGDLWQKRPGVFLRSHASIDDLRAHLRHLTRVQDAGDKWFFFRFCDAEAMYHYMAMDPPVLDNLARFFQARHEHAVSWILPVGSRLRVLRNLYQHPLRPGIMRLTAEEFAALRRGKWQDFLDRVETALHADHPQLAPQTYDIGALALNGFQAGFRVEKALYLYISATLLCRANNTDPMAALGQDTGAMSQMDRAEQFYRNSLSMTAA